MAVFKLSWGPVAVLFWLILSAGCWGAPLSPIPAPSPRRVRTNLDHGGLLSQSQHRNLLPSGRNNRQVQASPYYYENFQKLPASPGAPCQPAAKGAFPSIMEIDGSLQAYLQTTSLRDFEGTWKLVLSRSTSISGMLAALGQSPIKQSFMETYVGTTRVLVSPDLQSVYMENKLPMGILIGGNVPLDQCAFNYDEGSTGNWQSSAFYRDGRLYQSRSNPKFGLMYDTRAVFPVDPLGEFNVPMMLFQWIIIDRQGRTLKAYRWLKLISSASRSLREAGADMASNDDHSERNLQTSEKTDDKEKDQRQSTLLNVRQMFSEMPGGEVDIVEDRGPQ